MNELLFILFPNVEEVLSATLCDTVEIRFQCIAFTVGMFPLIPPLPLAESNRPGTRDSWQAFQHIVHGQTCLGNHQNSLALVDELPCCFSNHGGLACTWRPLDQAEIPDRKHLSDGSTLVLVEI
ncbi:hypothetical protein SDC9_180089 [bioreactor metagenome]|uniref:Uncharacterized protein n=1 Tax=bioreactor metagenome TaxID=1076179 RepID=A0A645H3N9_9ZZZZ